MCSWNLRLLLALLYFLVAAVAGEPSCENVEDFGSCAGDMGDFCPRDIACSCKSGQPFCSCPFYRGPNGNYWYMGKKCDQLWSTLDMVVICVFPAVALAFIVAVTAQLIHFCKPKSKSRTVKEPKSKSERKMMSVHQNQAFVTEEMPRNQYSEISLGNVHEQAQPRSQAAPLSLPAAEAPKPRRLNYYTDASPASRSSDYVEGRQQHQNNNGYRLPEQDYQGYEQQVQPAQYSRISRVALPAADYQQTTPEPTYPTAEPASRPYRFGRPQVRTAHD